MNKITIWILNLAVMFLLLSCHEDDEKNVPVVTRTVLMYLVADNNISSDLYRNITSVEQGLKKVTSPGTFVIYWDGGNRYSEFPVPTLFKYDVDGKGNVSKKEVIQTYSSQNSASGDVMLSVIKDMKLLCPAESYGLIFGSHATGWLPVDHSKSRSFGDDNGIKINIPELAKTLESSDIHFDYLLMDACLMSQVEVAYELRNVASYLILSPAEVMSTGFPYSNLVKYLMATDDVKSNAIKIAEEFINYYRSASSWGTIAIVKSDEMQALANITNALINQYKSELNKFNSSMLYTFQQKYGYGRSPLNYSTYDFRAFMRELTDNNIPSAFDEQLNRTVIYKDYVAIDPLVNIDPEIYSGIGCYIPHDGYDNWNTYFKNLQWYSAAGWNNTGW